MKKGVLLPVLSITFSALILFSVSFGLRDIAAANVRSEQLEMLRTVLPGSSEFTLEPYSGEDANIRSVHRGEGGFVIETVTAGYAGEITMLIGVTNEGTVTALVVREMAETYGLGANALTDKEFLAQFLNTSGEAELGSTVDAITGATVTSRAITRSISSAVGYVTGADVSSGATSWGG